MRGPRAAKEPKGTEALVLAFPYDLQGLQPDWLHKLCSARFHRTTCMSTCTQADPGSQFKVLLRS